MLGDVSRSSSGGGQGKADFGNANVTEKHLVGTEQEYTWKITRMKHIINYTIGQYTGLLLME